LYDITINTALAHSTFVIRYKYDKKFTIDYDSPLATLCPYANEPLTRCAKNKIVFPILSFFFADFLIQRRNPYNKDS